MKIYFAGSIRGGRDDQNLYSLIIETLKEYGTVLTEHIGKEELSERGEIKLTDKNIFDRDMNFLDECDAIVAEVTTPSLGVGYEIGRMENQKPILCLFRDDTDKKLSAMLAGNINIKIGKYQNISEIKEILEEFFNDYADI